MGGFASFIGGVGQQAGALGENERERRFRNQMETMQLNQQLQRELATRAEALAQRYPAPHNDQLNMLAMEIGAAPLNSDFTAYTQKLAKAHETARQAMADAAAAKARQDIVDKATVQPKTPAIGAVGGTPTPPPFAAQMSPPPQAPPAQPAAQPALSPVQPAAQGGGNSPAATFPTPTGSGGGPSVSAAPAAAPAIQPVAPNADLSPVGGDGAAANFTIPGPTGIDMARLPQFDLQRSVDAWNNGMPLDAVGEALLRSEVPMQADLEKLYRSGDINLAINRKKLEAIQPLVQDMHDHPENLFPDLMQMEVLMGGQGNAIALGPMLSAMAPQSVPGQETVASLETRNPGFLAAQGFDVSKLNPNQPVRVQRSKLPPYAPVSAEISAYRETPFATAQGFAQVDPYAHGGTPTMIPDLTPPAMAPRTTTQVTPGLPPTTSTTTRGVPGKGKAAPSGGGVAAIPPVSSGSSTRVQSDSYPAGVKSIAKAVADGSQPMPGDARTAAAVRQYMGEHSLDLPEIYSAKGQSDLAQVDPLIAEVQELKARMESEGLQNNDTHTFFPGIYLKYRAGFDTPYNDLLTGLSFESLRSAAQALRGSGSRAYPILNKALVHTPNLPIDTPKAVYDKLKEIEKILGQSRSAIVANERKSGVIQPVEGAAPREIKTQSEYDKLPSGAVYLEDGKKYRKP